MAVSYEVLGPLGRGKTTGAPGGGVKRGRNWYSFLCLREGSLERRAIKRGCKGERNDLVSGLFEGSLKFSA